VTLVIDPEKGIALAAANRGQILDHRAELLPSLVYEPHHQFDLVHVLKAGHGCDDVAVYAGLVWSHLDRTPDLLHMVATWGRKLKYEQAKVLFPTIDDHGSYRP